MHLNFSYLAWQLGRLQQYRQSDLRDAINSLASAIQQLQAKYADLCRTLISCQHVAFWRPTSVWRKVSLHAVRDSHCYLKLFLVFHCFFQIACCHARLYCMFCFCFDCHGCFFCRMCDRSMYTFGLLMQLLVGRQLFQPKCSCRSCMSWSVLMAMVVRL